LSLASETLMLLKDNSAIRDVPMAWRGSRECCTISTGQ